MESINGKFLNTVIDFDFIVNTELGLIRFCRKNFQDSNAFNLDILNREDLEILSILYNRTHYNPLSIISTKENMEAIDALYNSFFSKYKKEIIGLSISEKPIVSFVSMVIDSGYNFGINNFISIRDDIEKEAIISHFNRAKFLYKSDKEGFASIDAFYIKSYKFFEDVGIDKLNSKQIFISPTTFNSNFFDSENGLGFISSNKITLYGKDYRKNTEVKDNAQ